MRKHAWSKKLHQSPAAHMLAILLVLATRIEQCPSSHPPPQQQPAMDGNAFRTKYHDELIANAKRIARPGFGILAADESTGA